MCRIKNIIVLLGVFIGLAEKVFSQNLFSKPTINITALSGSKLTWAALQTNKASVLIFYSPECPICIEASKTIRELADTFAASGVRFYLIYPGAYYTKAYLRNFQKKYLLNKAMGYIDENYTLTKMLQAETTPQVFVLDSTGYVQYSGQINNRFESIGVRRAVATEFYLYHALEAVLHNHQPSVTKTLPVGCIISQP